MFYLSIHHARAHAKRAHARVIIEACFVDSLYTTQRYAATALRERGIMIVRAKMRVSKCGMPIEGYRILLLTQHLYL